MYGVSAEVRPTDLAAAADVEALAQLVALRRPAILVNAAGFGTFGPLAASDPATQHDIVMVLLAAPLRLTGASVPAVRTNAGWANGRHSRWCARRATPASPSRSGGASGWRRHAVTR